MLAMCHIYIQTCILDRLHGMNDAIGQKPLNKPSSATDFNASDEDR